MKDEDAIIFLISEQKSLRAQAKTDTVLQVLLDCDIAIDHSCGGNGSCGTCRILVEDAEQVLGPRSEIEAEMAEARGFSANERLACQSCAINGLRFKCAED